MKKELTQEQLAYSGRNFLSGFLFGLGMVAFIDEFVFHQLLQWHHFYDRSTTQIGLISDGLFHAFSWFATVGALFMLADLRRRKAWWKKRWLGGTMLGAGIFNLYDGLIQHKLMQLHQIRYGVDLLPYDLTWNILAGGIVIAGGMVLYQTQKQIKLQRGELG
ncbi:DUF2243 domain-containing protein [Oceanobacillus jeddahense]|uniref:DUF2243 domain-containing protein n=1 Tax=Oceanobacillus jeddahense TaxID=1462527 RepID=UPI000595DDC6|nr:DUF2243 domain-containing protein [Oceanobacillus jeddahense]